MRTIIAICFGCLVVSGSVLAQAPTITITEEIFHGRNAWVLQNGLIHVTVIAQGGHIAEMRLISDDPKKSLNPIRPIRSRKAPTWATWSASPATVQPRRMKPARA